MATLVSLTLATVLNVTGQTESPAGDGPEDTSVEREGGVEVTFEGDEVGEIQDGEEVEVTFAEEIDPGDFAEIPPLPAYDEASWLVGLPALCILLLAWNVRWKGGPRRHARR